MIDKNPIINYMVAGILMALIVTTGSYLLINLYDGSSPPGVVPSLPPGTRSNVESDPILFSINEPVQTSFGSFIPNSDLLPDRGCDVTYASDLSDVEGIDRISDQAALDALAELGFVVTESDEYNQFYDLYKDNNDNGIPSFITTDSVLHAYHVLYDLALRLIENDHFVTDLIELSEYMKEWAWTTRDTMAGNPQLQDALLRVSAFFTIGLSLLNQTPSIPAEMAGIVTLELQRIEDLEPRCVSPLNEVEIDYTQFIVRGHYTRNEALSNFFLAMMYYARVGFYVNPDSENPENPMGIWHTRMALAMAAGMETDESILEKWEHIYEPTVFFVGKADDLGLYEYSELLDGYNLPDLEDNSTIAAIIEEAKQLPTPLILGEISSSEDWENATHSFRFMGQRFVPDSYFLQNLVDNKVPYRFMPSGLDVMVVLNSSRAREFQSAEGDAYPEYWPQIDMLQGEVAGWNETVWTQNLYFLWLYSLLPLLNDKGVEYPSYMRSDAWQDRELNTALGSWAELRHDTILYAKQSYTYERGMAPVEGRAGNVEANPAVFGRLFSLTNLMLEGLGDRGLLSPSLGSALNTMASLLESLHTISSKHLTNEALDETEEDAIRDFGLVLESIATIQRDDLTNEADESVAVIADVHSDPNTMSCLEVGVGNVYLMYVILQADDGTPYLSRGGVLSYHEFTWPMLDRLTDETWQEMLENGEAAPAPSWMDSFLLRDES